MTKLKDVCRNIRSKNAGPFWVTVDLFFDGPDDFAKYSASPALAADRIAALFDTSAELVKHYPVPSLSVLKISYPRSTPQGGMVERDMHSGQQYVRLLEVELGE
ncbi:MAG: DUF4387 domain-containing protein [Dehalococcoidia bacterium]